jgi:serine/threonine protein kinase, bacterial
MPESDNTELDAGVGDGADNTAAIPDTSATEAAQLAWSMADRAPDVTSSAERQPLSPALRILLACVVVAAVMLVTLVLWHRGFLGSPQRAPRANSVAAADPSAATSAAKLPQIAPAGAPASTAQNAADSIRAVIPEVTKTIALTEDNDVNNLIGRPNGYAAATVLVDSRAQCPSDGPGVDCGATIEQWPSTEAAQKRADYIQAIGKSLPTMSEWTTVKGNLLLRVTGKLKPSAAETYKAAFAG